MKRTTCLFVLLAPSLAQAMPAVEVSYGYKSEYVVEDGLLFDDRLSVPVSEMRIGFTEEGFFGSAFKSQGLDTVYIPTGYPGISIPVPGIGDEERYTLGYRTDHRRWNFVGSVSRLEIAALTPTHGGITAATFRVEKKNAKGFNLFGGINLYQPDKEEFSGILYFGATDKGNFRLFGGGAFQQDVRFVYDKEPLTDYHGRIEWNIGGGLVLEIPSVSFISQGGKSMDFYGVSLVWRP